MKADHQKVANLVKTARGQLDGVLRMIDENRYCMDVAQQLLAVDALLKKAYKEVLKGHMESCVKEAVEQGDPKKIEELTDLLGRAMDLDLRKIEGGLTPF